jgi:hypothetical protein
LHFYRHGTKASRATGTTVKEAGQMMAPGVEGSIRRINVVATNRMTGTIAALLTGTMVHLEAVVGVEAAVEEAGISMALHHLPATTITMTLALLETASQIEIASGLLYEMNRTTAAIADLLITILNHPGTEETTTTIITLTVSTEVAIAVEKDLLIVSTATTVQDPLPLLAVENDFLAVNV